MKVLVEKLHRDAVVPEYQTSGAAGFDLHIVEDVVIRPMGITIDWGVDPRGEYGVTSASLDWNNTAIVPTGLAFAIPEGTEFEIRNRSSNVFKNIHISVFHGTIDSDYRGELMLHVTNNGSLPLKLLKGDRIAQVVFKKILQADFNEVSELPVTERGTQGFGHTGKN